MDPSVLIVGGTFDPPHRGHVRVAEAVADALPAARILFIPAGVSPHKTDAPPTPAHHRIAMLERAIRTDPRAEIARLEIDRPGASYFVDTLETLRAELGPSVSLRFLIGADQARAFARWHAPERILELAQPAIVLRPPAKREDVPADLRSYVVDAPYLEISSSDIREHVAMGDDVSDLVGVDVARYITEQRLYRTC